MNMYFTKISFLLFLLALPVTALAADAAAPAAQSAAWTAEDYVKAGFSGAVGGLLSAFVALLIGWANNKTALRIAKQKIDADKEVQELAYKKQIEKLQYEEKRKACIDYLSAMNPYLMHLENSELRMPFQCIICFV